MADLTFHTMLTATHKRATNFDPIDGCHDQPPGPVGAQYPIALQLTGHLAAQGEQSPHIVSFQGVSDSVFTQRTYAFGQSALLTFRFDAMESRKLASGSQEHSVKDLFLRVSWKFPAIRQSFHQCGEIKHLIEIGLELVPAQG